MTGTVLREWITIVSEADDPSTKLPEKIQKLIGKPIPMSLKDGRKGILTIEPNERSGLHVSCEVDGEYAGGLGIDPNDLPAPPEDGGWDQWEDDRGTWSVYDVFVNDPFRRQHIARTIYDLLARNGLKIMPSGSGHGGKLLPDGASLWKSQVKWKKQRGSSLKTPVYPRFWKPSPKPTRA